MKCKHYYRFSANLSSNRLDEDSWEILRCADEISPFAIEKTIKDYEENCLSRNDYMMDAQTICDLVGHYSNIVSLGVGKGILEWHIKRIDNTITVDMTDYTQNALELLENVFISHDRLFRFDMLKDEYSLLKEYDYVLMYRISTEFSSEQWRNIFRLCYENKIKNIIFWPTEILTLKKALFTVIRNQILIMRGGYFADGYIHGRHLMIFGRAIIVAHCSI